MELQKTNNQAVQKYQQHPHSEKLIQCLLRMELPEQKGEAKMELVQISRDLMPEGRPAFLDVVKYPMIKQMVADHGSNTMLKVLFLMVKDFCSSVNVVRNMNEDQMIEAASMLLDECGNFRLEDYTMMFSLGKRGDLVKIMDRLDIQMITGMMDEYWKRRKETARKAQDNDIERLDSMGGTMKKIEYLHPQDAKMIESADNLAAAIEEIKTAFTDKMNEK